MIRSLAIGDCDHYRSPYLRGVKQAMALLGHSHAEVSIRQPIEALARYVSAVRPHVLWTHMLLWPPPGSPPVAALVDLMARARRAGAAIVIHDGDYKQPTRHPHDLSAWCALALVNHAFDRSAWRVPLLRWPYFARAQERIAAPDPAYHCDLWFAGTLGPGPTYGARTALVDALRARRVDLRTPVRGDNTLDRTDVIAASVGAVLGFGRPEARGWVDTRVFQYPGAGGILLHDDVAEYLTPGEHYLPYRSGDVESILDALTVLRAMPERERLALRSRAFLFVQEHHSSVARVRQVLAALQVEKSACA